MPWTWTYFYVSHPIYEQAVQFIHDDFTSLPLVSQLIQVKDYIGKFVLVFNYPRYPY